MKAAIAAIYCRVSTIDKQDINTQLVALTNYAKQHNFEIYNIYRDIGQSGSKASRPAWDRLLEDMRSGLFQALIIYKLDRIGRSIVNLLDLFKEFEQRNINLISTTQNIDSSTPEGKMFRNMLAVFAEYERELTISRINDGLGRALSEGKRLGRRAGSKDKKPRRKVGYYIRWSKQSPHPLFTKLAMQKEAEIQN